jgi:membrane protein YdbS with pleckstrin-like domain
MARDWYVRQGAAVYGPYPSARVQALAREGRITPDTELSPGPTGPWHPATAIRGLVFPVIPPAPPGTPAAPAAPPGTAPPAERDLWTGRPSQLVNLRTFVFGVLLCWLVVPFGRAVWRYLIVRTTRYELTSQRLRTTRGIVSRHVEELELYRVKDTAFSQTVFERVFGLATVRITSSDHSTPITTIDSVPAPIARWVRETVRGCVEELRTRKHVREVDYSAEP